MDNKNEIKTIETMPGYKPLEVFPWKHGYGSDIKIDNIVIGIIDENWRDQYRAHMEDHFCVQIGRRWSYEYFEKCDDAITFIRDRWVIFLQTLMDHPVGCVCVECEEKQTRLIPNMVNFDQ